MALERSLEAFSTSLRDISWLSRSGQSMPGHRVTENIQSAIDREGLSMLKVWESEIQLIESLAQETIGSQYVDEIFICISNTIHEPLYQGVVDHFKRVYRDDTNGQYSVDSGLYPELMDAVKRDICWAAVEYLLAQPGFFTRLLELYRQGRWPSSWDGEHPKGQAVVL